ncbi:methyl-accepting chemotaxis sensory transducer with Cache sensor [Shimia isoporae]|uniref:Methyl-accepting chemotaxis sensory transducer with Cache sensor n=1 Tax=Shimia isoporae TaxID=647720 RepID=A0A4R1N599_9RHOB|nr:methyl-accepting chemotaxis protein [Shimia isoporae]TCL01212.1 methyl-accepting chemotaxis sensory transducer with Cache sensor [Shimia isoporae]
MLQKLFSFRIATKIYALIATFLLLAMAATWVILTQVDRNAYTMREAHIRDIVSTTVSQLDALNKRVEAGEMTLEEAKAEGAFVLGAVRYDGVSGYMFASDYEAKVVAHPRPDLMGKSQWNLQDPNGNYLFRDMIEIAKQGGGTHYYLWQNGTVDDEPVFDTKLSYALPFEPWGWMIGTGAFVDDIEAMNADLRMTIGKVILAGLAFVLLLGGLVARSVSRPVNRLQARMQGLADGDFEAEVPYTGGRTEIASMAKSITTFRDALKNKAEVEAREETARAERDAQAKLQQEVVADLAEGLNHVASGDLNARIEKEYTGAYEVLRQDYNKTIDTLRSLIGDIIGVSKEIDTRSRGIHSSAQRVAESSEVTATTLEQTSAALEDLTATVSRAADSAEEVNGIVAGASASAKSSGEVVEQAVDAMSAIENSSTSIANITGVIDDIAFQTNLLALNAGVEAARAGESGQGFAVVASEVRALAGRASEAASEIKQLIKTSGEEVSRGGKLVDGAGEALGEIAESVSQITSHVANITSGTREQSMSLTEINEAVAELDRSSQQNTAMFQDTLRDSEVLTQKAQELAKRVEHFTLAAEKEAPKGGQTFNSRRAA